jgi:hypothetical protein
MNIISFEDKEALPLVEYWKRDKIANFQMVHLINTVKDPVYVETGVFRGRSISFILQACPNIKEAWGVDFWKTNVDSFDKAGGRSYSQRQMKMNMEESIYKISSSGFKNKVKLIREDVAVAVSYFEDNSIDFLFLDHYLNEKDVEECLPMWYNKVKIGGYFAGHDWVYREVQNAVHDFRTQYDIQSPLSAFGGEWVWKKEGNI